MPSSDMNAGLLVSTMILIKSRQSKNALSPIDTTVAGNCYSDQINTMVKCRLFNGNNA